MKEKIATMDTKEIESCHSKLGDISDQLFFLQSTLFHCQNNEEYEGPDTLNALHKFLGNIFQEVQSVYSRLGELSEIKEPINKLG